jgi:uncharacterized protein (TIGR03000 family)
MLRTLALLLLGIALLAALAQPAQAKPPRGHLIGSNSFGVGHNAPSYYGYPLDDHAAGYYGGGRYNEYYNFGRGYGMANFPGPIIGGHVPPDYRGSARHPGLYHELPPAPPPPAASPLLQGQHVAHITIEVPTADAILWIEDQKTQQAGASRKFVSPPLDRNRDYEYHIKVRWDENGQTVEQTQKIMVRAGDHARIGFPTGDKKDIVTVPRPFPVGAAAR